MSSLACSFKAILHPQYDYIMAECKPWTLAFTRPKSADEANFWLGSALYFFCGLAYANCDADRVVNIAKYLTWFTMSDNEDDDPESRGCEEMDVLAERHRLLLACYEGKLPDDQHEQLCSTDARSFPHFPIAYSKDLAGLDIIWKDIVKDIRPKTLSRFLDAARDHLNANRLQAHYRKTGRMPGVEEYINALRRPVSNAAAFHILIEYGLDIELDDETMANELMQQLQRAAVDHMALFNDLCSCDWERAQGDYFNLPSVILNERRGGSTIDGRFTFEEAMEEALQMVGEVDKRCVRLMEQVKASKVLMEKQGVREYVKGLALSMAANLEWSHVSARYSHVCSSDGIVRSLPATASAA